MKHMLIINLSLSLLCLKKKVIPEYAEGHILYRATNAADHQKLHDNVVRILNAAAESSGCTVKITKEMEYQPMPHNELLAGRYAQYTEDLGVKYIPRAMQEAAPSGSTDMGNVAHYVPGIHPVYNIVGLNGELDLSVSNHSIKFTEQAKTEVAHEATLRSAKGLALTGLDVLIEPGFAEAIRADFEARVPKGGNAKMQMAARTAVGAGCGCH